jgi:transglutaminase-like putative cysteine protease
MNRFLLTCAVAVFASFPVRAADYLNGDWFILAGKDEVFSSDPEGPLTKELVKGKDIKAVAVMPDCGWAFLFGGNGIFYSGVPESLAAKVPDLWKITGDFRCLAFRPQGGWALLHDKGFAQDGIPERLKTQLEQTQKAGSQFRSIAFAPDGGWVLLRDRDFVEEGLPKDLKERLTDHYKKRIPVRCVSFTSQGDWFLIDDANTCFTNNERHSAYKKLTDLRAKGQVLNWIAFSPGEYTHGYVLEHLPVQRIKVTLSLKFARPEGGVDRWIVLPPQAPELGRQRDIKLTLEPESITEQDTGPLQQKVRLSRIDDRPAGFTAKTTYEMTLYTNRMVPRLAGQPAPKARLTPELHAAFTRTTDDMKTKVFQDFLDKARLRKLPTERDLAFARRSFLYIAKNFTYICPNPDKVDVVEVKKGDCGGLSWVYIRTLRANGIPARLILGRWAASEVPAKGNEPRNGQYHAKPEVFIDGLGWVGADMSGAVGVEGDPFVCFGAEPGDFVVLDLDVDRVVKLQPEDKPANLDGSQGYYWWWYTSKEGKEPQLEESWTVEVLDQHPKATAVNPSWKRPAPSGPHTPVPKTTDPASGVNPSKKN